MIKVYIFNKSNDISRVYSQVRPVHESKLLSTAVE